MQSEKARKYRDKNKRKIRILNRKYYKKNRKKILERKKNRVRKSRVGMGKYLPETRKYYNFHIAKKYAKDNKITSSKQWKNLPKHYPSDPEKIYKKHWTNWKDFLGTSYLSLNVVKEFARTSGFTSMREWREAYKRGFLPDGVPAVPETVYN